MRKLCPNLDREDGLDTVLEVPIPEEMFTPASRNSGSSTNMSGCNMAAWVRPRHNRSHPSVDLELMLSVIGAPLLPIYIQTRRSFNINDRPIETATAKYIVRQYIAAVGGEKTLDSITSMYAMGKVQMMGGPGESNGMSGNKKAMKRCGEMGGFVLWQKQTDLWCLELLVSGCKLSAGSDGKVTWRRTSGRQSNASRGPPRPLRRVIQGLDPRSTANLFSNAICTGEKSANGEACFVLRLDAEPAALRARSTKSMEIIRHAVLGYFSQRTGLLVQLEDSHLIRIEGIDKERVYWETTTETSVEDYRSVEGIKISHKGWTSVSLVRFGETVDGNTRTRMDEAWSVEEVDFNIRGLSAECFLPPGDLTEEKEDTVGNNGHPTLRLHDGSTRVGSSKVAALNSEEEEEWNI